MKNIAIIIMILLGFGLNAQTIEEYFQIGAENNPALKASYKDFEAAMQKVPQVSSLSDPLISFGYFISPAETRVGPQRAKISLNQMFPWFGTLKIQGDIAALNAEAKYQYFLDARNKLYFQVASAYYPLSELDQLKIIEQGNIEILESYKNIANKKFENGTGTMVDVLRADIMIKDAQTDLNILNAKERPLLANFNKLLNREENEKVVISDISVIEKLFVNFRRDSLLSDNPILEALDLKIKASRAGEELAIKQGLPKIGVGLDFVMVGKRTDLSPGMAIPEDNGKNILMPMVSLSIPIFRAKYKAAVKESQLMQESYSLQKMDYTNSLTSYYEMAWFEIVQQQELIDLYKEQIKETDQTLNLLFTSYGNSGKEFEEVLRMQQQLLKYKKLKATATTQYFIALAKLNYITSKKY